MIKKFIPYFISLTLVILLISCNDSPTDLGKDFVNLDGVAIEIFSSDSVAQSSDIIQKTLALGSSTRLLLGKSDNLKASTLMQFYFSLDTTVKGQISRNEITVLDSWVNLIKEYRYGDSAATFDYSVHKINNEWNSATFTADSLPLLQFDANDVSSQRGTTNDTTYSFHLDQSVPLFWLQNYVTDSINYNYGIYLVPTDNSEKVLGFSGYSSSSSDEPILNVVIKNTENEIDTIFGYIILDVSVVTGQKASVGDENIPVQSSLATEGYLYFDLNSLPDHYAPNDARLTLTVDTLLTKLGTVYSNRVVAFLVADSTKDSVNANYYAILDRDGGTFTGSIISLVRGWKSGLSNQGIIIKSYNEYYGAELFVIKGSNATNVADRPKLKILYSKR